MKYNYFYKFLGGCSALVFMIGLTGCSSNRNPAPIADATSMPSASFTSSAVCSNNAFLQKYHCSFVRVEQAARSGDADAQYALGYLYYYGIGTTQDRQTGLLWIRRAAAQGQPVAQQALKALSGTRVPATPKQPPTTVVTTTNTANTNITPTTAQPAAGATTPSVTQNVSTTTTTPTTQNTEKPLTDLLPNYGEKRVDTTSTPPPAVNLSGPQAASAQ